MSKRKIASVEVSLANVTARTIEKSLRKVDCVDLICEVFDALQLVLKGSNNQDAKDLVNKINKWEGELDNASGKSKTNLLKLAGELEKMIQQASEQMSQRICQSLGI